ncbi:MAG TPA: BON domain-containing protein [Candidatus Acidoferrales bacterium]|nr:BON domain-containing protein [Candidatus Acidoferrales bacterium]
MKTHALAAVPVLALMLAGLVTSTSARTVGETNPPVAEQVRHQLAMLPWYGVFDNLQYQVNGSQVILSGDVSPLHDQTKYDAERVVKKIPGVTQVVNDIHVLPLSRFDEQIRRAEFRTIFSQSGLGRYTLGTIPQIHIIVDNGHVTLEGSVINEMDRTVAGIAANTVPGVFSVTNNLRVGG